MTGEMQILDHLITRQRRLEPCRDSILGAFHVLRDCYEDAGMALICGNGGSSADADHLVAELMKGFEKRRSLPQEFLHDLKVLYPEDAQKIYEKLQRAFPAIALSVHTALCSAIANDNDPSMVFAQQVVGYGNLGDVLIAISTSGESVNVLNAVKVARTMGLKTIAITGRTGGSLAELCDLSISVPADSASDVQEFQLPVYHAVCRMLEDYFFEQVQR